MSELREAAQAVIDWEREYRTLNHLGNHPPSPFTRLKIALANETEPTPSEQLQAELEPLPETYYPPKKKLEDALKEGAPLLGTYPGKFHVG
jgi:hypothetical protein